MSFTREAACAALLSTVTAAYAWSNVPTRRLKLWSDIPALQQPALFQFEGAPETYSWTAQPTPKRVINVKLFVYIVASDASPGAPQLNAILAALDAALAPPVGSMFQTLGGTCFSARIKSVPLRDPGDIDGQGLLIVEIEIILP